MARIKNALLVSWYEKTAEIIGRKPRTVVTSDGCIGFPEICLYEITDGPKKGRTSATPPRIEDGAAQPPKNPSSWPYRYKVTDRKAFDELARLGF